jgi:hypothetical protein
VQFVKRRIGIQSGVSPFWERWLLRSIAVAEGRGQFERREKGECLLL